MTDIQTAARRTAVAPVDTAHLARTTPGADAIEADVHFVVANGTKPSVAIGTTDLKHASLQARPVTIKSARAIADTLDLDVQGFALVEHDTAVTDFYDDDQVEHIYYGEVEALLREAAGATKVVIFDHTRRKESADPGQSRLPVRRAHNDYTEKSGPQRVIDLLEASEASKRLKKRFAIVNIWRPINHPAETTPLAITDARSVGPDDFVATDLVYPNRVGEIYHVTHNPALDWYYVPKQRPDEVILLKTFDSAVDGTARWTAHTAVEDPTARADAPPRESIELRALIFFDD